MIPRVSSLALAASRASVGRAAGATLLPSTSAAPAPLSAAVSLPGTGSGSMPRRGFLNIFSNLKKNVTAGFQDKKLERQKEISLWQLSHVCNLPTYNMKEHVSMMETATDKAGVNGLMVNVASSLSKEQKAAMDEATVGLRIGKALTPEELADPTLIRAKEKLRIAASVGCDVAKVNQFMDGFESTKAMNEWAKGRKARGLPLPVTLEDFAQLIQQDRVGMGGDLQKKRLKDGMRRGGLRAILKKEVSSAGAGR